MLFLIEGRPCPIWRHLFWMPSRNDWRKSGILLKERNMADGASAKLAVVPPLNEGRHLADGAAPKLDVFPNLRAPSG